MNTFYNQVLQDLEIAIGEWEIKSDTSIHHLETVIELIITSLSELKDIVKQNGFINTDEEILFFEHINPTVVAKLIYYNAIYKIEIKKPYGAKPIRK